MEEKTADKEMCVPLFHASLLWPLQLEPLAAEEVEGRHWEVLEALKDKPWQRIDDEFTADPGMFQERHYREFVSFLPYAQRFLYGEGRSSKRPPGEDIGAGFDGDIEPVFAKPRSRRPSEVREQRQVCIAR